MVDHLYLVRKLVNQQLLNPFLVWSGAFEMIQNQGKPLGCWCTLRTLFYCGYDLSFDPMHYLLVDQIFWLLKLTATESARYKGIKG
jgi:hypothetical protein